MIDRTHSPPDSTSSTASRLLVTTDTLGESLRTETLDCDSIEQNLTRKKVLSYHPIGTLLNGRYELLNKLGEGGVGVVYRAHDHLLNNRNLALKIINTSDLSKPHLGSFMTEFRTMTELIHPNIAQVYDFEPIQGSEEHMFSMDFVEGSNAFSATRDKEWRDILDILVQICRALSYVHSRRLIHFDIKPGNVLVNNDGQARVLDFGIAGLKQKGETRRIRGTPHYMAPELIRNEDQIDHRVDLYALGIMAYQMLTGQVPFRGQTLGDVLQMHYFSAVYFDESSKNSIPQWLRAIVLRLCSKQPDERYRTANMVIDAFNREGGLTYQLETDETRDSYLVSSRFVGRESEIREIFDFINARVNGSGEKTPALFVAGPSGIGKSRLMREAKVRAQLAGMHFFEGNCYEGTFDEFEPIALVVAHVVRLCEGVGKTELVKRYASELVKVYPALAKDRHIEPSVPLDKAEAEALRLMDSVCLFLIEASDITPFVLYINDLQWARPGAAQLLGYVARVLSLRDKSGNPVPLALIGSYRDDEVTDRALEKLLHGIDERDELRVISVGPLDSDQVAGVVSSMLGLDSLPPAFAQRVARETAGNAFFVEEVMRALVQSGAVHLQDGQWVTKGEVGDLEIPRSMAGVFLRRAEMLSKDTRKVLDILSVCGRPCSLPVLRAVADTDEISAQKALAELKQRQMVFVSTDDEDMYQVAHDRMREVIYNELENHHRREYHRLIALKTEEIYRDILNEHLYELAHHYWEAGVNEKALEYCYQGAEQAEKRYANNIALDLLKRARDLLKKLHAPSPRIMLIEERIADRQTLMGLHKDAISSYKQAIDICSADKLTRGRLFSKLGYAYFQAEDLNEATEALWRSIEIISARQRPGRLRMKLETAIAVIRILLRHRMNLPIRSGKEKESIENTELMSAYSMLVWVGAHSNVEMAAWGALRAKRVSESLPPSRLIADLLAKLATVFSHVLGMHSLAKSYGDAAIEMAEVVKDNFTRGTVHGVVSVALVVENWVEAFDKALVARDLLLACGGYHELGLAFAQLVIIPRYCGQLLDANDRDVELIEHYERTGTIQFLERTSRARLTYGRCLVSSTGTDDYIRKIREYIAMHDEIGDDVMRTANRADLGYILMLSGQTKDAIDCLETTLRIRHERKSAQSYSAPAFPWLAWVIIDEIDALRRQGAKVPKELFRRARAATRLSLRMTRKHYPSFNMLSLIARARLLWALGKKQKAEEFFSQGYAECEKWGARLWLGDIHLAHALCLHEISDKMADEHFRAAREIYEKCVAGLHLKRLEDLISKRA